MNDQQQNMNDQQQNMYDPQVIELNDDTNGFYTASDPALIDDLNNDTNDRNTGHETDAIKF